MAWKNVQYENGKYRTSEGGGGGSSTFANLEDVSFDNLQNGQVPKYNSETQKWENADESGGGGTVTDVQVDGVSVVNQQGVAEIEMPTPPTISVEDVEVNGESVVDGNKVAQIKSYKEVTQAEYNALPDSKLNDGILYAIKDVGGSDGFPPLIYSDEEREVGVWRDGKPLYRKTINIGYLPNNAVVPYPHGIANLERVTNFEGIGMNSSGIGLPLPKVSPLGLQYLVDIAFTPTDINITAGNDRSGYYAYVTMYYTKTTDAAGSGTWTTQGAYAHHYSTDEQIVGTWIDGKTLYEKVITGTFSSGATTLELNYNISDGFVINFWGFLIPSDNPARRRPIGSNFGNNANLIFNGFNMTSVTVKRADGQFWGNTPSVQVVIQYTKTTD